MLRSFLPLIQLRKPFIFFPPYFRHASIEFVFHRFCCHFPPSFRGREGPRTFSSARSYSGKHRLTFLSCSCKMPTTNQKKKQSTFFSAQKKEVIVLESRRLFPYILFCFLLCFVSPKKFRPNKRGDLKIG